VASTAEAQSIYDYGEQFRPTRRRVVSFPTATVAYHQALDDFEQTNANLLRPLSLTSILLVEKRSN